MNTTVILKTEHLYKKYGSLQAVHDLSLEIYEGEVFGFLGPNGAGKTTSINMMCGLLKPDSGTVTIHGKPVTNHDSTTRSRVGVCPQEIVLWERLTCLEQLIFIGQMYGIPTTIAHQRSERLLEELDLVEKRNKQARTLSGGMQRRLNLAMALVHDPEIVVLDEPEAGLDPQSRVKVREYIHSLARRRTVILTTHDMDEAERLADRVAIIDHGSLLVLDTPQELKKRAGSGDILEISLRSTPSEPLSQLIQAMLSTLPGEPRFTCSGNQITLRVLDGANVLPSVLSILTNLQVGVEDIHLRANSLEDVFIHLTGRRLRE
ncbi:MAG TPA: ABC transporter ATP-binding protein [Anaerolineaceae bacterium]